MKKEEITELEPSETNVRDRGLIVEGLLGHYVTQVFTYIILDSLYDIGKKAICEISF